MTSVLSFSPRVEARNFGLFSARGEDPEQASHHPRVAHEAVDLDVAGEHEAAEIAEGLQSDAVGRARQRYPEASAHRQAIEPGQRVARSADGHRRDPDRSIVDR